ncbi:MAG: anhydro-N-acetylmuramic acid kinase [Gemmatimonadota bacterium]
MSKPRSSWPSSVSTATRPHAGCTKRVACWCASPETSKSNYAEAEAEAADMRVIGLMSGTSLDGIDAAVVEFADHGEFNVIAFTTLPFSSERREQIHHAIVHGGTAALNRLHADLGEWFAAAALQACSAAGLAPVDIALIGSHGQTIWHEPPQAGRRGATLQLGCAATIAERTGIPVVSDFRTRDVAAGGEGAPLVPWVDRFLFADPEQRRVLQNIGGMANLTRVPKRGEAAPLLAFDTGPGNALINSAVEIASDGAETYDMDGRRAARGRVDERLLAELLAHPFFARVPPKSTGREVFGKPFVEETVRRYPGVRKDWDGLIATLTALTARTITDAIKRWVVPQGVDEVIVTGGGSRNEVLMRIIRQQLEPLPVHTGAVLGVDPDAKEAVAFAALAWAHVKRVPANVPEATGAQGPRVLGSYTPGKTGIENWKTES